MSKQLALRAETAALPPLVIAACTAFTDRVLPALQEPLLDRDQRIVFCAAVDENSYLPTHNAKSRSRRDRIRSGTPRTAATAATGAASGWPTASDRRPYSGLMFASFTTLPHLALSALMRSMVCAGVRICASQPVALIGSSAALSAPTFASAAVQRATTS
jgi:hypothetical protein